MYVYIALFHFFLPDPFAQLWKVKRLSLSFFFFFSIRLPSWLAAAIPPNAGQRAAFWGCCPQRNYTPTRPVSQAAPPAVSLLRWFASLVPWETKKGAAAQRLLDKKEARLQGDHSETTYI